MNACPPASEPGPLSVGSVVDITVASLAGRGDGVAACAGKPLFIPKSCPGDVLRVRIIHENGEGRTAGIERILRPGPDRRDAPCAVFADCGGCSLQQLAEPRYREYKTRLLETALSRAGFAGTPEVIFLPPASRRRVEFKIHHTDQGLRLGFFAPRSRIPVPVRSCPILRPELDALLLPLQQALAGLPQAQELRAAALTLTDSGPDLLLHLARMLPAQALAARLEPLGLARIAVRVGDGAPGVIAQRHPVTMRFGATDVPLPPDAFLQAAAQAQEALVRGVLAAIAPQGAVVDLFSGLGAYSLALAGRQPVHAVELEQGMVAALKRLPLPGFSAEKRDLFRDPLTPGELSRFAAAVINPPRAGAQAQTRAIAASKLAQLAMVSCNPATFTRDAALLREAGFRLDHAWGLDQFVWSRHLEIFAAFSR